VRESGLQRNASRVTLQSPAAALATHQSGVSLSAINLIRMPECARSDCVFISFYQFI
jgi:hypothetical protein